MTDRSLGRRLAKFGYGISRRIATGRFGFAATRHLCKESCFCLMGNEWFLWTGIASSASGKLRHNTSFGGPERGLCPQGTKQFRPAPGFRAFRREAVFGLTTCSPDFLCRFRGMGSTWRADIQCGVPKHWPSSILSMAITFGRTSTIGSAYTDGGQRARRRGMARYLSYLAPLVPAP